MDAIETTRLSSKGQVVIPESVRRRLGLTAGQQFVVLGEDDVVVLKSVAVPTMRDFDRLISEARKSARNAGLTRADVARAVKKVRGK